MPDGWSRTSIEIEIDQLFGNYGYTIGIGYEDRYINRHDPRRPGRATVAAADRSHRRAARHD